MDLRRTIYNKLLEWKDENSEQVLQLEGARQVGKTYILQKFAKENYKNFIYINMAQTSGRRFSKIINDDTEYLYDMHDVLNKYTNGDFIDTKDTIIIIDEIQESSDVYSRIREFAREFSCNVIVTGSYLGRVLNNKDFFLPAGDIQTLAMHALSFEEFLDANGMLDYYNSLDLFGSGDHTIYDKIKEYYDVYCVIGGYPAVVSKYVETHSVAKALSKVEEIVNIFVNESTRYLSHITDITILKQALTSIANIMSTEKQGNSNLVEEIHKQIYHKDDNRINKKEIHEVISWLYTSKMIGYCGSVNNGDRASITSNRRFYFSDNGVAFYFLQECTGLASDIVGILNENFVYSCLVEKHMEKKLRTSTPNFCLYEGGELDFFEISNYDDKVYGIEVKAGKGIGTTANKLLSKGKIDYLYLLKGDTYGGKFDEHKYTIPIYLCPRLEFNLGERIKLMNFF